METLKGRSDCLDQSEDEGRSELRAFDWIERLFEEGKKSERKFSQEIFARHPCETQRRGRCEAAVGEITFGMYLEKLPQHIFFKQSDLIDSFTSTQDTAEDDDIVQNVGHRLHLSPRLVELHPNIQLDSLCKKKNNNLLHLFLLREV